jgi:hypothetical protein
MAKKRTANDLSIFVGDVIMMGGLLFAERLRSDTTGLNPGIVCRALDQLRLHFFLGCLFNILRDLI